MQLVFILFDERVGLVQLVEAGNHRIHHFDVALDSGAQDRAELGAENVPFLQAKPNRPPSQKWIHLLRHLQMREELVAAQIQRADDHRMRLQCRRHLTVSPELLLFVRQRLAVEEKIFRAEQPHALRAAGAHMLGVSRLLDVR